MYLSRRGALSLLAAAALLLDHGATLAIACSCGSIPSFSSEYRKADSVFIGKVISVRKDAPIPAKLGEKASVADLITLAVEETFKGPKSPKQEVWLEASSVLCTNWTFRSGDRYLVYADEISGMYVVTTFCGNSKPLPSQESKHTRELERLKSSWFRFRMRIPLLRWL